MTVRCRYCRRSQAPSNDGGCASCGAPLPRRLVVTSSTAKDSGGLVWLIAPMLIAVFAISSGVMSGQFIFRIPASSSCSLADGHDHAAMAAIDCFPDATNTGVPNGTSLSAYTGATTITANGTTIDAKTFEGGDCPLSIQATGVVITNSEFNCTGQAISVDDQSEYTEASNGTAFLVTVKDSYISCGDVAGSHGVSDAYIRLIRVHLELCENGSDVNQKINWEDSFIHNLSDAGGVDEHADGSQHGCGHWEGGGGSGCATGFHRGARNVNYLHNTILGMMNNDTDNSTSAIIMNKDLDVDENILVQHNRVGGGAFTIYCNQNVTGTNIQVKDNWFWTVYPQAGATRTTDCSDEADISGNKTYPAGTPITLAGLLRPGEGPMLAVRGLWRGFPQFSQFHQPIETRKDRPRIQRRAVHHLDRAERVGQVGANGAQQGIGHEQLGISVEVFHRSAFQQGTDAQIREFGGAGQIERGGDEVGNVLGLNQPLGAVGFPFLQTDLGLHPTRGPSQKHAQHANAIRVDFITQAIGQGFQGVFGRAVLGTARAGLESHGGVQEHDLALSGSEVRQEGLGDLERGADVDRVLIIEVFQRATGHRRQAQRPRAVNQDIDRQGAQRFTPARHGDFIAEIDPIGFDAVALLSQGRTHGGADPARTAGDDRAPHSRDVVQALCLRPINELPVKPSVRETKG